MAIRKKAVGLAATLLALAAISAGALDIGDTRETVIDVLGEPEAQIQKRSRETLYYGDQTVELAHGVVVAMDHDIERSVARLREKKAARPVVVAQAAAAPAPAPSPTPPAAATPAAGGGHPDRGEVISKISNGGQAINLSELLVPGKITVVDFYADWCGPCRRLSPLLETMARNDPDIYLRKIDIVKWGTPVAEQFDLHSIPNVRVFDRQGNQVGTGTPDLRLVEQYVAQAK